MIKVNSGRQAEAGSPVKSRGRSGQLALARQICGAAAILMLAGCLNFATSAHAQTPAPDAKSASCLENCTNEKAKCPELQTSEEMCDYDFKQCTKACETKETK